MTTEPPSDHSATTRETDESLTLDMAALTRAAESLSAIFQGVYRTHHCGDYIVDDLCSVCWSVAGDVLRAAEGFKCCDLCNGTGRPGPEGDACPDCGGNGLWPIASDQQRKDSDG